MPKVEYESHEIYFHFPILQKKLFLIRNKLSVRVKSKNIVSTYYQTDLFSHIYIQ